MHTHWIAFDRDDRWRDRCDKLDALAQWTDAGPLYLLAGPGLFSDERFLLISRIPWTAALVRETLADINASDPTDPDSPEFRQEHAQWVSRWLAQITAC